MDSTAQRCAVGMAVALRLAALGCVRATASTSIGWVSNPVLPGEHISLQGAGFTSSCRAELRGLSGGGGNASSFRLPPIQPSNSSLKLLIPPDAPLDAYRIALSGCQADEATSGGGGGGSSVASSAKVNLPEPWWVQSDGGDFATPGGWIRLFGNALSFRSTPPPESRSPQARRRRDDAELALREAVRRREYGTPHDDYRRSLGRAFQRSQR